MQPVRKLAAATAVALSLAAGVIPATEASASAVYAKNGNYQFASYTPATSGDFIVSNRPLSYSDASQSIGAGQVNLSASGSGDSGVIVPLGRLDDLFNADGQYIPPTVVGSNLESSYNLYFDTNANDTYLGWAQDGSIDPYILGSYDGDNIASIAPGGAGDINFWFSNSGEGTTVPGLTSATDMQQVKTDFAGNTNGDTNPLVWAWFGMGDGVTTGTGSITSVNGVPLVTQVPAVNPVKNLTATAKYTTLTAKWTASRGATSYHVRVTTDKGTVTVASASVTGTSYTARGLKEKTTYAVHVLAKPAASGAKQATVYVTTK